MCFLDCAIIKKHLGLFLLVDFVLCQSFGAKIHIYTKTVFNRILKNWKENEMRKNSWEKQDYSSFLLLSSSLMLDAFS